MAMIEPFDWRRSDRMLFAAAAILFPTIIIVGFARTYYLKFAFDTPPLPSFLVHIHGVLMTTWIAFFITQVWLIRSKRARVHMKLGMIGLGRMGRPMASNLCRRGFKLTAYDINPAAVLELQQLQARAATSVAEAAVDSDVIVTMVPLLRRSEVRIMAIWYDVDD